MKYLLGSATIAASLLLTIGIAAASAPQSGSVIRGRVIDSFNQGPLGGVRVDVFNDSQRRVSKAVASTTTAKDGSFALSGLGRGRYHLELEKRGYALEIVTDVRLGNRERFLIERPLGMRTAVVTIGIGQAMETRL